jgi:hypothetical protein
MTTPDDPTRSIDSLDAVIAEYLQQGDGILSHVLNRTFSL